MLGSVLKAKGAEMNQTHMLICNHKSSQIALCLRRDAGMKTETVCGVLTILGSGLEFAA